MSETGLRICLVGAAPRGTSVLERLCANAPAVTGRVVFDVFDPAPAGPGAVWRRDQHPELLMNTVTSQVSLFTDDSVCCSGPDPGSACEPTTAPWPWVREHLRGLDSTTIGYHSETTGSR